ncbi:MAG: ABC transporter ATP-binding protein [Abditibacteriota bacterium]|nr:ABC transporter ATP-binding protein [Abditibacteriota bacterium]
MKRWYKYIKPWLPAFILGPLCMLAEVVGEVVMPKVMSLIVTAGTLGTLTAGQTLRYTGLMVLTAVLMGLGGVGGAWFGGRAAVGFAADLREDIYNRIQGFSFANTDRFSAGSLVTRLTNDVTQLQNFINMILRMGLRAPGMMAGALIMAIAIRPSLTAVFLVSIPVLFVSVFGLIKTGFPRFSVMQEKLDRLNSAVQENITNVRVVKSFVREDHEKQKFARANRNLKEACISAVGVMIIMPAVMTVVMNLTIIAVLWMGGAIVLREQGTIGGMQVGDLSAFVTYVTQILSSLMFVTFLMMTSSRAFASAKRIAEVLDEVPDISDEGAQFPEKKIEKGEIEFRGVCFRYYKDHPEEVLENIDLRIPAGSTVGIIGSTGCGKTTLVSLIPRLYDCDKGEVLVDGVNVKDYSLYNLRDGIGMVLQKSILFTGSVEDNLRFGAGDATRENMEKAARTAQAHGFIENMPAGYESPIEQGGANVSGGQKQRLCIARALLTHPRILIMDDSVSAVDTATEAALRQALETELKDTTAIIIAQRINSVMGADIIVVMDDGRITGAGTHEELLETNGEYREIYYSQTGREEVSA